MNIHFQQGSASQDAPAGWSAVKTFEEATLPEGWQIVRRNGMVFLVEKPIERRWWQRLLWFWRR